MKRTASLLMAICMVFALMVNASAFELSAEDTVKPLLSPPILFNRWLTKRWQ